MRILITGATGYVGRNLTPKLINTDNEICILIRNIEKVEELFGNCKGQFKIIDLSNIEYKRKIKYFNPDLVIHLASYLTSRDDNEAIDLLINSNIEFGTYLLDSLKETTIRHFINIGTSAEYYNNNEELKSAYLYSATKTAFRSIIKYYKDLIGFQWINIIPYSIYGGNNPQKKVLDYIVDSLDSKEKILMSPGNQRLDFIHIEDVVDFFDYLIKNIELIKDKDVEFHLGTGKGTSLRELACIIERIFGKKTNIKWSALDYRPMDIMKAIAPVFKTTKVLNWNYKISIEEGIEKLFKEICSRKRSGKCQKL